jgi:hypothetical protein
VEENVTEQEGLTCNDPAPMLEFLTGKASAAKLRHFSIACVRRLLVLLRSRVSGRLPAGTIERFGALAADWVANDDDWMNRDSALATAEDVTRYIARVLRYAGEEVRAGERRSQASLLRCVFGNPFQPKHLDLCWLTSTVIAAAQAVYRDSFLLNDEVVPACFIRLADALKDAGCADAAILDHCHGSGPHVRECWVVDLLLGTA